MVLNTFTTAAMVKLGKVYGNLMVDLQVTCEKLRDRGERILMETLGVDRPDAARLLEQSGGHVKTAIVMGRLNVDAVTARKRLDAEGGACMNSGQRTVLPNPDPVLLSQLSAARWNPATRRQPGPGIPCR